MEMTPAYGIDPATAYMLGGNKNDDGFSNNPFSYLIFAWLMRGFNIGGIENQGITNDFMFGYLNNDIGRIQDSIAGQTAAISNGFCSMGNQFGQLKYDQAMAMNALQNQLSNCCCETNRNIDSVKYENQAQTTAILQAICEDGRATRDLITSNTIQELRDNLQSAQIALSNSAQTQQLQAQLDAIYSKIPVPPTPAYIVPYPCA